MVALINGGTAACRNGDPTGGLVRLLQANVLQAGKIKPQEVNGLVSAGFGQPLLAGAAAGALTGGFTGSSGAGLGLGVLAASALVNYAYQDVTYAVTVDIQLSERPLHGANVAQSTRLHHGHHNASYAAAVTEETPETFGASSSATDNDTDRYQSPGGIRLSPPAPRPARLLPGPRLRRGGGLRGFASNDDRDRQPGADGEMGRHVTVEGRLDNPDSPHQPQDTLMMFDPVVRPAP